MPEKEPMRIFWGFPLKVATKAKISSSSIRQASREWGLAARRSRESSVKGVRIRAIVSLRKLG